MGRKYGSLHMRLDTLRESIDAIRDCYISIMKTDFPIDVKKVAERLGLSIPQQQLTLIDSLVKVNLPNNIGDMIVEHDGYISLSDDRISFENIQTIAKKLSSQIESQVFFSSVYDDDVFIFGLCQNGKTVSLHVSGTCEAYGLSHINHNIEGLEKYFSRSGKNSSRLQDLSAISMEDALIEAIGFNLDI